MLIQICDVCKKTNDVTDFYLPYYEKVDASGGWRTNTPTFEFSGKLIPTKYSLCQECSKRLFRNNIGFMLGRSASEYGIDTFNVRYNDEV